MPKGFYGDSERHRAAGAKSRGNTTRGADRRGGKKCVNPKKEVLNVAHLIGSIEIAQKVAVESYNAMGRKFGADEVARLETSKIIYTKRKQSKNEYKK